MPRPRPSPTRARPRENRAAGPTRVLFATVVARIAVNVRALRLQRKLTQEGLAERASLSTVGVAVIEAGRTNVTTATLCQLAGALGVDPSRLLRPARAGTARQGPKA